MWTCKTGDLCVPLQLIVQIRWDYFTPIQCSSTSHYLIYDGNPLIWEGGSILPPEYSREQDYNDLHCLPEFGSFPFNISRFASEITLGPPSFQYSKHVRRFTFLLEPIRWYLDSYFLEMIELVYHGRLIISQIFPFDIQNWSMLMINLSCNPFDNIRTW